MNIPSILVVDDEPNNFDVIETLLTEQNYQLHYAANGVGAIANLDTFNPDLILLDVMMPGIDGIEVCRQIRAMDQWQVVPIIMVTALTAKSDLAACLSAGADDFISKPVNALELRARIHSMLRIKQQYDNIQSLAHLQNNTIHLLENSLSELRGNLASSLSHELNTPLNGMLGMISLIKEDLETMPIEEIQELIGYAEESALRLEALTKKFLIYLELELMAHRLEPTYDYILEEPQTYFDANIIQSSLMKIVKKADRQGDLVIQLTDAVLALSDRYLNTIIRELIDNAIKFSQSGTPIKVRSNILDNRFVFSVHDFGRGMTEEHLRKVGAFMQFERKFYEQQGVGLGLKIINKIVESVGGELKINSVYNQETQVKVILPLWVDPE
ncbi:MAG: hybrid sensor histidine kinase/response regulator [Spirulina sp. DLM2.Bin59]|nr:MAG: hybrid sensor histidine kinase/response regulator [Spirulina sp. DLM2.Bin59]